MIKLTPVERGVLFALMAAGRPLRESSDLRAKFNIHMTQNHRRHLNSLGLVKTTRNPFMHELTDEGWKWAAAERSAKIPPGTMGLGPLYALFHGIDRALQARNIDLRTFFAVDATNSAENQEAERRAQISDAAWSDSELVLAYALQDMASFQRVIKRFNADLPPKLSESLRQVELAAESIFQNIRLAATKRNLALTHTRGAEAVFDPVAFEIDETLSSGEPIKVAKSPVVKSTQGATIVVARGAAEPA